MQEPTGGLRHIETAQLVGFEPSFNEPQPLQTFNRHYFKPFKWWRNRAQVFLNHLDAIRMIFYQFRKAEG